MTIDRPAAEVHALLADAASWPQWAIINVLAVAPGDEPGWWKLSTPDGPAEFRIRADSATGLVDHDFRDDTKGSRDGASPGWSVTGGGPIS